MCTGHDTRCTIAVLLSRKAQILPRRYTANRVGVAFTTAPSLDTDDHVTLFQYAEVNGGLDAPLQTAINILLPVGFTEVGLLLGEEERIHPAIQM